ncbi:hypothetical protein Rt10032_c05g2356 [Rhodotorula toruloides]|uniref:Uncharacterized protein n=1 Tax=Rhodotorula toruloides TaxID=5286 RepID=A0A511KD77_RHOTO|nr:hypothetical protein Rt10032_c05g2356 [Rhodotorula toruloides]
MSFQTASTNTAKSASAFSGSTREDGIDGNTSTGVRGGPVEEATTAHEMGITMGNAARIRTTERESDHTEPNVLPGEAMSTAGPGGDYRHREAQSHEMRGLKQRLENNQEREDREAAGYGEPINRNRLPIDRSHPTSSIN